MNSHLRPAALGALLGAALLLGGGCTTPGLIGVATPKVYGDDVTLKTLARRRGGLGPLAASIQAGALQEARGVRQGVRYDAHGAAAPSGGDTDAASLLPERQDLALPEAPEAPDDLGLRHRDVLRELIRRDRDVMGYELLYLGDDDYLDPDRRVALVRLDVSIDNYLELGSAREFAVVKFTFFASKGSEELVDITDQIRVYSLAPEFDALVAQESLASLAVEDYSGTFSGAFEGIEAAGTGRFQRQLEETLVQVVQQPLQFAVYDGRRSFAFAFGPQRRITRRSPLNPMRWFGNTYEIEYFIQPGVRPCYALVVLPAEKDVRLQVVAEYQDDLVDTSPSWLSVFDVSRNVLSHATPSLDNYLFYSGELTDDDGDPYLLGSSRVGFLGPLRRSDGSTWRRAHVVAAPSEAPPDGDNGDNGPTGPVLEPYAADWDHYHVRAFSTRPLAETPKPKGVASVTSLHTSRTTDFLLDLKEKGHVVSPETVVYLGPVRIPSENLEVLGRFRLHVRVPPSETLRSLGSGEKVTFVVSSPGQETVEEPEVELRGRSGGRSPGVALERYQGRVDDTVIVRALGGLDLSGGVAVEFAGVNVGLTETSSDAVAFEIPDGPAGRNDRAVVVKVTKGTDVYYEHFLLLAR